MHCRMNTDAGVRQNQQVTSASGAVRRCSRAWEESTLFGLKRACIVREQWMSWCKTIWHG